MSQYEPSPPPQACAFGTQSQEEDDKQKQRKQIVASMKRDCRDAIVRLEQMNSEYDSKLQQWMHEEREVKQKVLQEMKDYYAGAKWALQQDREECTKNLKIEISFWKRKLQLVDSQLDI